MIQKDRRGFIVEELVSVVRWQTWQIVCEMSVADVPVPGVKDRRSSQKIKHRQRTPKEKYQQTCECYEYLLTDPTTLLDP